MTSLLNLNAFVPPVSIPPVPPNFAFCNGAYGTGLKNEDAINAGGLLPQGIMLVTYSIERETQDPAANISARDSKYRLPILQYHGGVWISVDIAGPVNINKINVVPNDIRGMAGYVANHCVRRGGVGGFVTKRIQGLVDFVTNPRSDIEDPDYPDSTAFLTLTVSNFEKLHSFPGDYDPQMANFLWKAEADALGQVEPSERGVIAERLVLFAQAEVNMRRLGSDVPWWGGWSVQGNGTAVTNVQRANTTTDSVGIARRKRRVLGPLR